MQTLAEYINIILMFFYNLVGDYGVAIIMLTVLVNIIMFPLSRKQLESSRKIQEIQPELKRLQEKYKHDKEKYNQVTMEFMREHKVNPLGGCLPLLIQLPIMIAIFQLLRDTSIIARSVENFNPYFLFFGLDLTKPDPLYILPIMSAAATFFHQRLVITDPKQKMMQYIFPIMILVISISFPAGLLLYWFTNSLLSVGNHFLMKKLERPKIDREHGKKEKAKDESLPSKSQSFNYASDNLKDNQRKEATKQGKKKKVKASPKKDAPKGKKKAVKGKKKGAGKTR
ncbi:MAG: YidC/Oxa1 family membrane protein insertase [Firmicutes bacterium]|nr:YidC/Oxa1 family membrane protein insertase [Bacillota bacterium]